MTLIKSLYLCLNCRPISSPTGNRHEQARFESPIDCCLCSRNRPDRRIGGDRHAVVQVSRCPSGAKRGARPAEATPAPEVKPAGATESVSTTVSIHKIDASTDTAMVDSLDFISRQLDPAAQQQLQDDYNVIQTALERQAASDDLKDGDSLAAVRKAVDGKTAAELSVIADQLKPKI